MLKFIVDESTGKRVADFLQQENYDVLYVRDWKEGAKDIEIMDKAEEDGRVIVTNDKDFGKLSVKENRKTEGIILLRLKNEVPENKIKSVRNILEDHKDKIKGNLIVGREDSIKLRKIGQ